MSKIYNVLIVDDDRTIRNSIAKNDSWEQCGFSIVDQASNGVDALQILRSRYFDLVVTDIYMPIMDGIKLIHNIREEFPQIQVLVLSNYDDYEYVRTALKLGAFDYMLKYEVSSSALYDMLNRIREKIENNVIIQSTAASVISSSIEPIGLLCEIIHRISSGESLIASEESETPLSVTFNGFAILIRAFSIQPNFETSFSDELCIKIANLDMIRSVSTQILWRGTILFYIECSLDKHILEVLSIEIKKMLSALSCSYISCIARLTDSPETSFIVIQNAVNAINLADINSQFLIHSDGKGIYSTQLEIEWIQDSLNRLCCAFVQGRIEDVQQAYLEIAEVVISHQIAYSITLHIFHLIMVSLNRVIIRHQSGKIPFPITYLDNSLNIHFALERLIDLCKNFKSEMPMPIIRNSRIEIYHALCYMQENLDRSFSLADVAKHVNLSRNYFCKLFRSDTGVSFVNYLNLIRVDRACKLINSTNMQLNAISESIGYNNYHYFCAVFKRQLGKTPAEYRAQMIKGGHIL